MVNYKMFHIFGELQTDESKNIWIFEFWLKAAALNY